MALPSDLSNYEKAQARRELSTVYRQRPHALAPEVEFETTDAGLAWEDAKGNTGTMPWGDVVKLRLTYDPARAQAPRHVLEVTSRSGAVVKITSTTYVGMAQFRPRNRKFVAFLEEMHARLKGRAGVAFITGRGWALYALYLAVWIGCLGFMAWGIVAFALANQLFVSVVVAAMTAWFGRIAYVYARNNRPGTYDPTALPHVKLPRPSERDV
jgi:hypothetical protein